MSEIQAKPDAVAIAECRLDPGGLRDQRERYGELARQVTALDRRDGALEVRFGPGLDAQLLEQTLAIERECCPFFRLDYDPAVRRLTASVERADEEPALEAIACALTRSTPP